MAARLDLYRVPDGASTPGFDPTDPDEQSELVGYVSASDDDEQALYALLEAASSRSELDASTHGSGRISSVDLAVLARELDSLAARNTDPPSSEWIRTLRVAVSAVVTSADAIGWDMRYDMAGSADDGADEFPTSWSHNEAAG